MQPSNVDSVIELLKEAIHEAPEFRDSLATENLDRDLASLLESSIFLRWRDDVLSEKR